MNLADRLAAARNQRRIEAGLPPLPGFEVASSPTDGASDSGDIHDAGSMADVIDLTARESEPPVIDLRTDPGDGYDLTDPNAVLSWHWEPRDYAVEPPPTHGTAWATFDETRRQAAGADDENDLALPNNSTWAERYQALRNQRRRPG